MTNQQKGILALVTPPLMLVTILLAFAVIQFFLGGSVPLAGNDDTLFIANIIRIVLSFLGIISVLGIFVGVGLGIYFLSKPEDGQPMPTQMGPAYAQLSPEQVKFIRSASLGAFFGTPIWAFGNRLYLYGLLSLLPIVNIFFWIYLSAKGRQLAWEKGGWTSFDQFKHRQKVVAYIIAAFLVLYIFVRVMELMNS